MKNAFTHIFVQEKKKFLGSPYDQKMREIKQFQHV